MLLFFILNLAFIAITCSQYKVTLSNKLFTILFSISIIINIVLCIFIFIAKQKKWSIAKTFLFVGSTLGIMYLFAIPIWGTPDAPIHFWRVYSISQGGILPENQDDQSGNLLPENIVNLKENYSVNAYRKLLQHLNEPISNTQIFKTTTNSNPIDYSPQILGILTGRILHLPMIVTLYLARLFGLIFCIGTLYICIKYIPILKTPLFFISCLPISMQTFVAISYDGVIFCSAISLITFVLYTIYNNGFKLKTPHFLLLTIISFTLIAVKPVYFPLCFLLFFIPKQCFKNKKTKTISIISILFIICSLYITWLLLTTAPPPGNGANANDQIAFIVSNPIKYIIILIHNILGMSMSYIQQLQTLEWLNISTNEIYTTGIILLSTILCIKEYFTNYKAKISKSFRLAAAFIIIITTILIFTALYIQWTPVGEYKIAGVQTRYLLPILIIIPLLCASTNSKRCSIPQEKLVSKPYFYSFMVFLNLNAIFTILCVHV